MYRKNLLRVMLAAALVISFILSACQSAPAPSAPAKAEAPKAEAPKAEAPKAEAPKAEAKPAEAPKAEAKPAAKEPYKLGLLWEATGAAAAAGVGAEIREGAILEADRINAAGGIDGHQVQLVIEDNGSDPTKTATAIAKLTRDDKVSIILGPAFSPVYGAAINTAEREQTPIIIGDVPSKEMQAQGLKWTIPGPQPDEQAQAYGIINILKDKGFTKIVAISSSEPNQEGPLNQVKKDGQAAGITVLTTGDTFGPMDLDMTAQAQKVKALATQEKAQALFLSTWFLPASTFIKGMQQLGFSIPIVGHQTFADLIALRQFGAQLNGATVASYKLYAQEKLADDDPQKPLIVDFNKRFQAKYNKAPSAAGQIGADWVGVAAAALKTAGADRTKLRDAMKGMTNQVLLSSVENLSSYNHFQKQSMAIYNIKDSKFEYVRSLK